MINTMVMATTTIATAAKRRSALLRHLCQLATCASGSGRRHHHNEINSNYRCCYLSHNLFYHQHGIQFSLQMPLMWRRQLQSCACTRTISTPVMTSTTTTPTTTTTSTAAATTTAAAAGGGGAMAKFLYPIPFLHHRPYLSSSSLSTTTSFSATSAHDSDASGSGRSRSTSKTSKTSHVDEFESSLPLVVLELPTIEGDTVELPAEPNKAWALLLHELNKACSSDAVAHGRAVMTVARALVDTPQFVPQRHATVCDRYAYLLGRAGDVAETRALLAHLAALRAKGAGVPAAESTYSSAITTLARAGCFDDCEVLLDEMTRADVAPHARTFSALVEAHARAGNIDDALETLRRMETHGCRRRIGDSGYDTLDKCTAAIIGACSSHYHSSSHNNDHSSSGGGGGGGGGGDDSGSKDLGTATATAIAVPVVTATGAAGAGVLDSTTTLDARVFEVLGSYRAVGEGLPRETFDAARRWFGRSQEEEEDKEKGGNEGISGGVGGEGAGGFTGWSVTETSVTEDGTCRGCGQTLESIELPPERQARLVRALGSRLSVTAGFDVQAFDAWLDAAGPTDVIVDVLNVTHWRSHRFDLRQLDAVLAHYRALRKSVIMVARAHVLDANGASSRRRLSALREEGSLFVVPNDVPDDYFFLYAAVRNGMNVELVTNDQMRDHYHLFKTSLETDRQEEGEEEEEEEEEEGSGNNSAINGASGVESGAIEDAWDWGSVGGVDNGTRGRDGNTSGGDVVVAAAALAKEEEEAKQVAEDFLKWCRGHQIKFEFTQGRQRPVFRPNVRLVYDSVVQRNAISWHAPRTSDGQWLCCVNESALSG